MKTIVFIGIMFFLNFVYPSVNLEKNFFMLFPAVILFMIMDSIDIYFRKKNG